MYYRSFVISLSLISLHRFGFLMRVTTPTTSQTPLPYMLYTDDHNLTLRDHLLSLDFLGRNSSGRTVRQRSQYLCVLDLTQCYLYINIYVIIRFSNITIDSSSMRHQISVSSQFPAASNSLLLLHYYILLSAQSSKYPSHLS